MKKRILIALICFTLLLTMLPLGALKAEAASELVASEEVVQLIIGWEGFAAKPFWDYGQWTVGYGTRAPAEHLERYRAEGISKEEATQLLNDFLNSMGKSVNSFADKFGLTLTQAQFDALLSFTFNCGSMWMLTPNTLRTAVVEGLTGDDMVFYFAEWSAAGGTLLSGLTRRRLSEANLYLNGVYDNKVPENYHYVYFDANGGETEIRTQGFISGEPVNIRTTATYEGCEFEGWYTDPTGGEKVETLDASLNGYTLYAHWRAGEGTGNPQDAPAEPITGTPANYIKQISALKLNVFDQPVKGAMVVDAFMDGDLVDIVAEYTDSTGVKWGKISGSGWINLTYTREPEEVKKEDGVTVKVTGTEVNIRRGPGTTYTTAGVAQFGQEIVITQTATGSGYTWGKFNRGWIALKYTNYDDVVNGKLEGETPETEGPTTPPATTEPTTPPATTEPVTPPETTEPTTPPETTEPTTPPETTQKPSGPVNGGKMGSVNADYLYMRSGPGVANPVVGGLKRGERVEILEQKAVGGLIWGRTEKGWVSLKYIKLDSDTGAKPEQNKPEVKPEAKPETTAVTGKVKLTSGSLNIRSGPSTGYTAVGSYANGTPVTILEQKTVGTVTWGRTDKGWISMTYVKLDESIQQPKPEDTKPENTTPEQTPVQPEQETAKPAGETGTISLTSGTLRIRSGAGTNNTIVGNLTNGAKVTVTDRKTVNGVVWGKIANGWISLDYVKFGTTSGGNQSTTNNGSGGNANAGNNITEQTITGKVNVSDYLCIRNGAGTNYTVVGYYTKDASVTITEQKNVGGTKWGRTNKGWISLDYVILDGEAAKEESSKPAGTTGTVSGTGLRIRSGAGTGNRIVGSLTIGDKVTILETTTVDGLKWGRIERGWICLDYVKMD